MELLDADAAYLSRVTPMTRHVSNPRLFGSFLFLLRRIPSGTRLLQMKRKDIICAYICTICTWRGIAVGLVSGKSCLFGELERVTIYSIYFFAYVRFTIRYVHRG
ncbi:hypothetical protein F4677DRAFT_420725 [Hypoxylon crocopeplum]|nr:hypothetical protein F4677DRAFT_420725 [Hypoxylon crocopeplum]